MFCFVLDRTEEVIEYRRVSLRLDACELKQTLPLLSMQWASHCRAAPLQGAREPWKGTLLYSEHTVLETLLYLDVGGCFPGKVSLNT